MKEFSKFLIENWRLILEIALVICSAVVFIIRKKPIKVVDNIKEKILLQLPIVISIAEEKIGPGKGPEKLKFVIDYFVYLFDEEGILLGKDYIKFIETMVEQILSTPKKK